MIYYKDENIIIRDIQKDDTPFLFSWWVDRSVNRYDSRDLPVDPQSLMKECREYCSNLETEVFNPDTSKNIYRYFITTDVEGVPIGFINAFDYDAITKDIELGIIIGDKRCWNRGIGTKMLHFVLKFLFNRMSLNTIHVETGEHNIPALRLFHKIGFQKTGEYYETETLKFIVLTLEKELYQKTAGR